MVQLYMVEPALQTHQLRAIGFNFVWLLTMTKTIESVKCHLSEHHFTETHLLNATPI